MNWLETTYVEDTLMWNAMISDIEINIYATDEEPLVNYAVGFRRAFDASFSVQSPYTGNETVSVAIDFENSIESESDYQTGTLEITAADGSSVRMLVDNGDPDTFQLTFS